ncbi:hypothetical protein ASJ33_00955 [Dehalococcoides mccartyi]|nr:hypothetical protein ASJ33_00955 [Dehalococcoides mccartyi]
MKKKMGKLFSMIKHVIIPDPARVEVLQGRAKSFITSLACNQLGNVNVGGLIMLFMAAFFLMALTPALVSANATIQADVSSSDMVKTIMDLLVWAIPLGGGAGIIMAAVNLFRHD